MMNHRHTVLVLAAATLLIGSLALPAAAQEITVDTTEQFCFSRQDFTDLASDDGIFFTALPSQALATVRYGSRALQAGDALPARALAPLTPAASPPPSPAGGGGRAGNAAPPAPAQAARTTRTLSLV